MPFNTNGSSSSGAPSGASSLVFQGKLKGFGLYSTPLPAGSYVVNTLAGSRGGSQLDVVKNTSGSVGSVTAGVTSIDTVTQTESSVTAFVKPLSVSLPKFASYFGNPNAFYGSTNPLASYSGTVAGVASGPNGCLANVMGSTYFTGASTYQAQGHQFSTDGISWGTGNNWENYSNASYASGDANYSGGNYVTVGGNVGGTATMYNGTSPSSLASDDPGGFTGLTASPYKFLTSAVMLPNGSKFAAGTDATNNVGVFKTRTSAGSWGAPTGMGEINNILGGNIVSMASNNAGTVVALGASYSNAAGNYFFKIAYSTDSGVTWSLNTVANSVAGYSNAGSISYVPSTSTWIITGFLNSYPTIWYTTTISGSWSTYQYYNVQYRYGVATVFDTTNNTYYAINQDPQTGNIFYNTSLTSISVAADTSTGYGNRTAQRLTLDHTGRAIMSGLSNTVFYRSGTTTFTSTVSALTGTCYGIAAKPSTITVLGGSDGTYPTLSYSTTVTGGFTAATSPFGTTTSDSIQGLTYNSTLGKFLAVTNSLRTATSTDGITWTLVQSTSPGGSASGITSTISDGGYFYTTAYNSAPYRTTTGTLSTKVSGFILNAASFGRMAELSGTAYGLLNQANMYSSYTGLTGAVGSLYKSTDLNTWTNVTSAAGVSGAFFSKANNTLFVTGNGTTNYKTTDNVTWTTFSIGSKVVNNIAYNNGMYLTGGVGWIAASKDGTTWYIVNYTDSRSTKNFSYATAAGNFLFTFSDAISLVSTTQYNSMGVNEEYGIQYYTSNLPNI